MRLSLVSLLILAGCGGGGSPPSPPNPVGCTAAVQWEPSGERTDGTPMPVEEIAKFTIFVSNSPEIVEGALELEVDITDRHLTAWEVPDLRPGQHWFYMTVTDTEGRESTYSNVQGKQC